MKKKDKDLLEAYQLPKNPSSDGYYHINVKAIHTGTGKRKQLTAKTLKELKEKLLDVIYEECPEFISYTVKEVFDLWQEHLVCHYNAFEYKYSTLNTVSRNKSEFKRFIASSDICNMHINKVSAKQLRLLIINCIDQYHLSHKGLDSLRSLLSGIYKYAVSLGQVESNLALSIDYKDPELLVHLRKPMDIQSRAYTDEQVAMFLDYIHVHQEKYPSYLGSYAFELQILTGLRRGEIPPLRWDDIVVRNGIELLHIYREQITVKKTKDEPEHFVIVGHTKNERLKANTNEWGRYFPLTKEVKDLLVRLKHVQESYYPNSKYLFPAGTDEGVITNNVVYNFYRRAARKLNCPVQKEIIRGTHSFRRNAITTTLNASGGDIDMVAKVYGNSPEVIRKYYYTGIDYQKTLVILNNMSIK